MLYFINYHDIMNPTVKNRQPENGGGSIWQFLWQKEIRLH